MARSVNKITLIGHLGADPELRYLPNGTPVVNVPLATHETWQDQNGQQREETTWFRLVVFGKLAEIVSQYFKKGTLTYVEGKVRHREWQDKEGNARYTLEVMVRDIQNLSPREQSNGAYQPNGGYQPQPGPAQPQSGPTQPQVTQPTPPQGDVNQPTGGYQPVSTPPPGGDIPDPFEDDAPF